MTRDADEAANFYRDVAGWSVQKSAMPGMDYILFNAGPVQVAGAFALGKEALDGGARPGWVGYVGVENVDMAAADVKAAGGSVYRGPDDIPGVGRFAMVADPQGAAFALFHPAHADDASPAAPGTPGHFAWHELYAGDGAAIFPFYRDLFGWAAGDAMDMGPMGKYQMFGTAPDAMIGGIMTKPPQMPAPAWAFYIMVPSIEAASAKVKSGGGQIVQGPQEVPGGQWTAQGIDPQGAHFALVGAK
jgi:hypothetical protein